MKQVQTLFAKPGKAGLYCLALFLFTAISAVSLSAEIVYLKNGKVLKGTIINEGNEGVTLKTSSGEVLVGRDDMLRILYGNQDMEEVYVLFRDGTVTKGFLVDQDEKRIVLRDERFSSKERTIYRKKIREISRDNIFPLDLEIYLRPVYYMPLDSGGADLKPSPSLLVGMGFNSMVLPNLRIMLESGYISSESSSNDDQSFRVIPVTFNLEYRMGSENFFFAPRLGAGIGIMEFDDGEGEVRKSNGLDVMAGLGVYVKLFDHLILGVGCDYMFLYDGSDYLQSALVGITCSYRL